MRILFCNKYNFEFSGTEVYLFSAMAMLRAAGHETALFSMADARGKPTPHDRHLVRHVDFKKLQSTLSKVRLGLHAIYSTEARKKLGEMIQEFRPDVAHVRNIYHHLSPSILWELRRRGVPVVYHVNDFKVLCPAYNMVNGSGEPCEKCKGGRFGNVIRERCYAGSSSAGALLAIEGYVHRWIGSYTRCVDAIVAPSEFVKQKFIEYGWDPEKIKVLSHFQSVSGCTLKHPGSEGPVLFFGRLSREKGVEDVVAAARRLPHLRFVLAGDGPLRRELETRVAESRMQNVRFAGHVSGAALDKLIAESQFTVFPSHAYETFGKSILESYGQGRAVVASNLGSRRELVHEGQTGLLYAPGNVNELTRAIEFLSERPALSMQMGETGRAIVIQKYSPDEHCQRLVSIYESLCSRKAKMLVRPVGSPRIAFIGGRGVIGRYSGIETFYEQAGRRLAARGIAVTAYCRDYFTPAVSQHEGIRVVRLPTIRSKHLDTFVHTFYSTLHACFSDQDVIHYHTLGPALFSWLPRLFGKKTIVSVQGLDWRRKKWSWFARQVLKAGEWASIRLPNKTIVVSRTLQSYYLARYGTETAYIPNGTELRWTHDGQTLERLGLRPSEYVLFLGRFSPEKNCDMLIDAFEKTDTSMKLVLAGGSSHTDDYAANLRKKATRRVLLLDWLSGEALDEVLTNAALFVLPSDMEGLSLALLDAMGAGVCVLASDVPENREAIGEAGFTFRRGDATHLQQMLAELLGNPVLRRESGSQGRARVQQSYSWEVIVEQLEDVYSSVKRPAVVRIWRHVRGADKTAA